MRMQKIRLQTKGQIMKRTIQGIWAVLGVVMLSGCGSSAQRYFLSASAARPISSHTHLAQIGVDKVVVPSYCAGTKIPVQSGANQLTYRNDAVWASVPEQGLTEHAIAYFQKRFSTPNVYRYPWDIEHKRGVRLQIALDRFVYVAATRSVELEGNYRIESMIGHRHRARLFRTSVPVAQGKISQIIYAMNRAFDRLLESATQEIVRF